MDVQQKWWHRALVAMDKRVKKLLAKHAWARKVARYLDRFSFRTGLIIFISNFVFYLLIPVAAFWVRPTAVCVVTCATLWTLSKITRYVGFIIISKGGYQRLKRYCERRRQEKVAPKEKKS